MNKKILFGMSIKDILIAVGPALLLFVVALVAAYKFIDPAPPDHIVISTGQDEGNYQAIAALYQEILKQDGIRLELRKSAGAVENLQRLQDSKSDVDVGFIQDGIGSAENAPDLVSLGSLYYEPIWIFYRGKVELGRLSQLAGKKIAVGREGGGTRTLSLQLLKASGVDAKNARLVEIGWQAAADALRKGEVDAAFFLATPDIALIHEMVADKNLRLMSLDQAEAVTRQLPFLHHLVLPHGSLDLKRNLPAQDTHLVSPTATLVARDTLHPALMYLLLKAASEVHSDAGLLEKKHEFPTNKDSEFPISDEANLYYKSGPPFLQRYLPFWVATLIDRLIVVLVPVLALLIPMVRVVPGIYNWRVKSRIHRWYGELKFLETQLQNDADPALYEEYLDKLDWIEERVNHMKVPLSFSEHSYVLREHIELVRGRLNRLLRARKQPSGSPPQH